MAAASGVTETSQRKRGTGYTHTEGNVGKMWVYSNFDTFNLAQSPFGMLCEIKPKNRPEQFCPF